MDSDTIILESTVMAIRERLMQYFKGSVTDSVVMESNVSLVAIDELARYRYQRRDYGFRSPVKVRLGGVRIATLQKEPARITFQMTKLNQTKELRIVHRQLEAFMKRYLPGVEVNHAG